MTRRNILVVDDEDAVRRFIAEVVESADCDVLQANSAESAMTIASANRIDAFLLDIDMPGASGTSLCRMIREIDEYRTAPILFVTGTTTDLEEAFAAGCDDLISKPIDPLVLR